MMDVAVLMTNCQVEEKPNSGPDIAQTMTSPKASEKVGGRPDHFESADVKRENKPDEEPLMLTSQGDPDQNAKVVAWKSLGEIVK